MRICTGSSNCPWLDTTWTSFIGTHLHYNFGIALSTQRGGTLWKKKLKKVKISRQHDLIDFSALVLTLL